MELQAIKIGNKFVKFLFFRPPDMFYFSAEGKEPCDIPLFLGSDVLAGSTVLQKNYARVHARYGKDGMASRLKLNGIAIEGIPNLSSLWFYTVQGLFKVMFEYLGMDAQKNCLTLLTETWLATCDLPNLVDHMDLHLLTEELAFESATSQNSEEISQLDETSVVCNVQEAVKNTVNETGIEVTVCDGDDPAYNVVLHPDAIEMSETPGQASSHLTDDAEDFIKLLNNVTEYVLNPRIKLSSRDSLYRSNLLAVLKMLRTEYSNEEDECCIPFSVLEQYGSLTSGSDEQLYRELNNFHNDFGIPVKKNLALCLFGEWIGKEFNSLTPVIAAKAEKFKLENIDRVHNLPKAESLIDILFPQSMKTLLFHWMSSPNNCTTSEQDHTYSPPHKKGREENLSFKKPVFPFIQIILEFANSALVSGVAHVIHTRLLHDSS